MLPIAALLVASRAFGMDDAEAAAMLRGALLDEAAYGNHEAAIAAYKMLIQERPLGDPKRDEALFRLAVVQASLGRVQDTGEPRPNAPMAAIAALRELIRTGACRVPCHTLLGELELELGAVRDLPVHWTFSDVNHGVFHPWQLDDGEGSIRVQSRDEAANPALIWRTFVDVRNNDQLVVGFDHPRPAPRKIGFRVQAHDRASALRIRVVDDLGRSYELATGPIRVFTDRPTQVQVDLTELVPTEPGDPPLDPGALARLILEDVSALSGTAPGRHELYLDDVSIE